MFYNIQSYLAFDQFILMFSS